MPRVKMGYDAVGKVTSTRLATIYDAANQLFVDELKEPNPIPLLCHREHMTPAAVCRVCCVEVKGAAAIGPRLPAADRAGHGRLHRFSPAARCKPRSKRSPNCSHRPPASRGRADRLYGENELELLAKRLELTAPRFPPRKLERGQDDSSLVIAVDHDACILCDRCVRACDEVRENNVIGRMGKGYSARIAFDLNDPMGNSSCVACGECMISCPTGALTNRAVLQVDTLAASPRRRTGFGRRSGRAAAVRRHLAAVFGVEPRGGGPPPFPQGRNHLPRGGIRLDRLCHGAGPLRGADQIAAEPRRGEKVGLVRPVRPAHERLGPCATKLTMRG